MAGTSLTRLVLKNNQSVYTVLPPWEVRQYLSKGVSMGSIEGFTDTTMATPVYVGVHAIVLIHQAQVLST